jgi:pilus assembly protein CpaB
MDTRKVILLAGALVVAVLTAVMARSLMAGSSAPQAMAAPGAPAPVDGPMVLVATRALPVGTILEPTALKFQPWPKELVEGAYFIQGQADMQTLVGTVVRNAITAGQPLTQGALVKPGDRGFMAAALSPGMRAVTIPVSSTSSVAGFVFPGDRIDLVLTQSVEGQGKPLKVSETVMRNVRVLATDQRTDKGVGEDGKTVVSTFSTVTIEATPKMAEQVAVAQQLGSLSISLRSIADNTAELEEAIASGAVKVPEGTDPKAEKQMMVQLATRPQAGSASYATGADVSRFARRSVPPVDGPAIAGAGPVQAIAVPAAPGAAPVVVTVPRGPTVRIARGNNVTEVAVGGKN